ncbi:MAG TPA: EF-hand domain-containing protein [Candidatus Polarisedimenticolia bacterium]|nr:EF-hand domain-containing protein [Candidatus Polarisedimenticolia bacterium]
MRRRLTWFSALLITAPLLFVADAFAAQDNKPGHEKYEKSGRYRGLDRNNDGVISRDEWRGNSQSFSVHDRNNDGVLSGDEIHVALDDAQYDDFAAVDSNRDGIVSRSEWRWSSDEFDRLDYNPHDGALTRQEYLSQRGTGVNADPYITSNRQGTTESEASDRNARFRHLDRNGDGKIARAEWDGNGKSFEQLDANNNGELSRDELSRTTVAESKALFNRFDQNKNGTLSKTEWRGDAQSFARLDQDNDGKVGRGEFAKRYRALEQRFGELDRDHSGILSREEWRGQNKAFERLDDNRDDQISFEEFVGVG